MDTHSNEASTRSMNGNLSICETLEPHSISRWVNFAFFGGWTTPLNSLYSCKAEEGALQ